MRPADLDDAGGEGARYRAREVTAQDSEALTGLFSAAGSNCYCRYWNFEGDKNEWLDRSANHPDESRRELEEALRAKSPEARGVIAESSLGRLVGWLKLSPATHVTKAYQQRYYRSLPCFSGDRKGVYLVGCVLVDPEHRRLGVARALVAQAITVARSHGATSLEAMPRRTVEPVTDEELWLGPLSVFQELGFREVHRSPDEVADRPDPYPVLRIDLAAVADG